jgi:two-component system chemotaxis sensor kinase CheA
MDSHVVPTISLSAQRTATEMRIEIADNGRGINWDLVANKAASRGLPHSTRSDLLRALLTDGVSTAETVTEVSGRGIGMASVKSRIEAMGGRIEVASNPGHGTCWQFVFPLQRLDENFLRA